MIIDLRKADLRREVIFEGGQHDGEEGNTHDYFEQTEDGDLIDHLSEMTKDYLETGIGAGLRYLHVPTWHVVAGLAP